MGTIAMRLGLLAALIGIAAGCTHVVAPLPPAYIPPKASEPTVEAPAPAEKERIVVEPRKEVLPAPSEPKEVPSIRPKTAVLVRSRTEGKDAELASYRYDPVFTGQLQNMLVGAGHRIIDLDQAGKNLELDLKSLKLRGRDLDAELLANLLAPHADVLVWGDLRTEGKGPRLFDAHLSARVIATDTAEALGGPALLVSADSLVSACEQAISRAGPDVLAILQTYDPKARRVRSEITLVVTGLRNAESADILAGYLTTLPHVARCESSRVDTSSQSATAEFEILYDGDQEELREAIGAFPGRAQLALEKRVGNRWFYHASPMESPGR